MGVFNRFDPKGQVARQGCRASRAGQDAPCGAAVLSALGRYKARRREHRADNRRSVAFGPRPDERNRTLGLSALSRTLLRPQGCGRVLSGRMPPFRLMGARPSATCRPRPAEAMPRLVRGERPSGRAGTRRPEAVRERPRPPGRVSPMPQETRDNRYRSGEPGAPGACGTRCGITTLDSSDSVRVRGRMPSRDAGMDAREVRD